jgi:2'-5' RNA ligase
VRGVGGAGVEALAALEAELRTALEALGVGVETPRPYTPHLTLARARGAVDLPAYGASVERVRWEPVAVTLYESRPEAGRRRYVPLGSVPW